MAGIAAPVNAIGNIVNRFVRHALPLDGNPGGAPEYLSPGSFGSRDTGLDVIDDMTFTVR